MIDQILTFLGITHNYEFIGILVCGAIVVLFLFEFLFWLSSLFHKLGGY